MGRRSGFAAVLLLLALFMIGPVKADASWVQNSNGTYTYYNKSGKNSPVSGLRKRMLAL